MSNTDTHIEYDDHGHNPYLHHWFDTEKQQYTSNILGMWLFIATEILMFGGLFVWYSVYRTNHPEIFQHASSLLNKNYGAANTLILLFSSFTMAWAVRAAQLNQTKILRNCLLATILCAVAFMGIKAVEYTEKINHGYLWGKQFNYQEYYHHYNEVHASEHADPASQIIGPEEDIPKNIHLFFGIYFLMTGLHGLHVMIGIFILSWLYFTAGQGRWHAKNFAVVDMVGLFWHIVDMIWIFLFPLFYLIG
ncbi:MAG TPA: cytochrome c oxidase subunit 3 family protein [bacterium]|jgi:cytochrome c oxidase subunit 3